MPCLEMVTRGSVTFLTDMRLRDEHGILVAFGARTGGTSVPPFESLNLAAHVGDDAEAVDRNRDLFLRALGIGELRDALTTAEQVHGDTIAIVTANEAGSGSRAAPGSRAPIPASDALLTLETGVPLLMLYADCVPVIIVSRAPARGVAVVHSGWKGALARVAGAAAGRLAESTGCDPSDLLAFVGPHVRPCHYEVDADLLSRFGERFDTIAPLGGRLDLGNVVSATLIEAGLGAGNIVVSDICTAETTDLFFSYRSEGQTGRHGALAAILGPGR